MALQVLVYTRALPTRLAVRGALDLADIDPVVSTSPVELLEKVKSGSWDAIILDGDSSPVPLSKLLGVLKEQLGSAGAVVLAFASKPPADLQPNGSVQIYERPLGRLPMLGALNRMFMARGKKPILRAPRPTDPKLRRALRVPMLVPIAFRSPAKGTAWKEVEVLDVSVGGAGLAALPGTERGEIVDVRNLLTREEASFRVAWLLDEFDEVAGGMAAQEQALRFWLPQHIQT